MPEQRVTCPGCGGELVVLSRSLKVRRLRLLLLILSPMVVYYVFKLAIWFFSIPGFVPHPLSPVF